MNVKDTKKRRYFRFSPDKNTLAALSFSADPTDFQAELVGLVFEESYKGCGLICLFDERLGVGTHCLVECGDLGPVASTIRWINQIDKHTIKVGIEYNIQDVISTKANK